jgi:hypothetical protein
MKAGLIIFFFFLSACATVDYLPPTQGTSAELQSILAKSLEENMQAISFEPAGKVLEVHVKAFGSYQSSLGLERYVQSLFQEWVIHKGGKVGLGQFRIEVFLSVLGDTATRRDLSFQNIPLYYSERFQAMSRMVVVVRDEQGKVVNLWQGGKGVDLADMYLMRIFGPFDVPSP